MDNMIIDLFQKEQYEKFKNIYKKWKRVEICLQSKLKK
jgi:hypothetical protein